MPFTTNAELESNISSWLGGRTDISANIPDFITLFEAWAARKMKVRPSQATTMLTPSSGSVILPTDYLGYIRATVTSSMRVEMTYVSPSYLQALYPSGIADAPRYFTIEGSALKTRSSDATGIEFLYNAKNTAVSSALNWLYINHPDAYLYGSLAEAGGFTSDPDMLALWSAKRDGVFNDISLSNFREQGLMQVRVGGAHP